MWQRDKNKADWIDVSKASKTASFLIFLLVTTLIPIFAAPVKASADTYTYSYRGYSYYRYSISVFVSVKITVTRKYKSPGCTDWSPTNVSATPGPIGTNAVFLSWKAPKCGTPSGGYQINLTEKGGYDAGSAAQTDGSLSYSSGKTKYLQVGPNENRLMIEGFGSSKVVDLQVSSLGQYGQLFSNVVTSSTAQASSTAVSPTTVTLDEITKNFQGYTGTSGLRVRWEPSSGNVSYYVLQYTDNLNQDLVHTELTAKSTTREMYIENYANTKYKVRVKSVGVDGSIAFSDYAFITARFAPSVSNSSSTQSNTSNLPSSSNSSLPKNKSEVVPVLPALTPDVKQVSSDPATKIVKLMVTNYQSDFSWAFNTYGVVKAEIDNKGYITLSGVSSCGLSGLLIVVNRNGYLTGTANPQYEMKCEKLPAPTFGSMKSDTRGFSVQVTNYDPSLTYHLALASSSNAIINLDKNGLITATGISSSSNDTLIVLSVTKEGFYSNQSEFRGFAVDVVYEPILGPIYQTSNGLMFKINNFDPQFTWYTVITGELPGRAKLDYSSGTVSVSPLRSGEIVELELSASKSGNLVFRKYISLTGPVATIQPALTPTFAATTSQATGFTSQVSNYNSSYIWSVSSSAGSAAISSTGLITVSGLAAGQAATVTVRTDRSGYSSGTSTVSGQAAAAVVKSLTPAFGALSSAINGFWIVITNYDPSYTWTITSSQGTAAVYSNGNLGVSNIGRNTSVKVTVTATKNGISSSASTVGTSN